MTRTLANYYNKLADLAYILGSTNKMNLLYLTQSTSWQSDNKQLALSIERSRQWQSWLSDGKQINLQ